jgi:hypothetical protein
VLDPRNRFIRTTGVTRAAGTFEADAYQGHGHGLNDTAGFAPGVTDDSVTAGGTGRYGRGGTAVLQANGSPITNGLNGTPRTANETRPINFALLGCYKL